MVSLSTASHAHRVGSYIGAALHRVEDARLLTGRGRYVADVTIPRMLHVAFVRSVHSHALIGSIDTVNARRLPGVEAVLTANDLPAATLVDGNWIPGLAKTPQPVIARDKVRFVGEPLAIVVASSRYAAEDAAELVDVDYEPLPPVLSVDAPPDPHVPLFDEFPDDLIYDHVDSYGDPGRAFAEAACVVRHSLTQGRSVAAPMECRGIVAEFNPASGTLDIWCSTQSPHLLRRKLALATGIAEHLVRVHMHDVGGGFGQKIAAHPEELAVAMAAAHLGLALKWVEDRRENLMAAPHARGQRIDLELALRDDGMFAAMRASVLGDAGAYSFNSASALIEPFISGRVLPGPYRLESYECRVVAGLTNKSPIAPYRGVGFVPAQAARELLIDLAARTIGMDRLEIRRRNLVSADDFPYRTVNGLVYDSGSYRESLDATARLLDYDKFAERQREARRSGRLIGLGLSPYVEPTGWGTEGMNQIGWHSFPSNDSARVSLDLSGKVTVSVGTPSVGQGVETTIAQIAADTMGVPFEDVTVRFGDTSEAPISLAGTRASRVAVVTGGAVGLASEDLRRRVLAVAAAVLETDPQALTLNGGHVLAGEGERSLSVAEVVQRAFQMSELRAVDPEPNFTATRFYDPRASYSNACIGATVEIDPETGAVTVTGLAGTEDCGTVINPAVVDGQFIGGMVQGLGAALIEELVYDPSGEIVTTTFMDYLLPTAAEVPPVQLEHRSSPSPNTWRGIKGVGESGAVGAPAAVAAAIADALGAGVRVQSLPLRPELVLELIRSAPGDTAD